MTGMWYAMESDSTAYAGHTIVHAFGAPTLMRQRITERGILWVKRSVSSCQNKKALPFIVSGTSWVRCVVPDVELQQTSRGASNVECQVSGVVSVSDPGSECTITDTYSTYICQRSPHWRQQGRI